MIKPLIAWFRGEPAGNKAVKDKGENNKTPDGPKPSATTTGDDQDVR